MRGSLSRAQPNMSITAESSKTRRPYLQDVCFALALGMPQDGRRAKAGAAELLWPVCELQLGQAGHENGQGSSQAVPSQEHLLACVAAVLQVGLQGCKDLICHVHHACRWHWHDA